MQKTEKIYAIVFEKNRTMSILAPKKPHFGLLGPSKNFFKKLGFVTFEHLKLPIFMENFRKLQNVVPKKTV